MRTFLVAFVLSGTMAMLSQTALSVDKPRILHGPLFSEVFSYPSIGGLVRKRVTRVELDWLGLTSTAYSDDDSTSSNKTQGSHDINEEDNLALRIMQLGGRWWPSRQLYERHNNAYYTYGHHYPPDLDIGYPSTGGVLVLRTWADNSQYLDGLPGIAPEKPNTWSRLSICATMKERCNVLRDFGAVMYDSVEECPDVPKSLEEGIARDREYERLLKKMEDREYVAEWLNSL